MKKIFILLLLFFAFSEQSYCQWRKLFDFGSGVRTIYFKEYSSTPLEGFVSVDGGTGQSDKLWRTLDGGATWQKVSYPVDNHGWYPTPGSFTFKSRSEGWFSEFLGHDVYRTIDGGASWVHILGDTPESQIEYIPSTGRLILSGSPTYYYSTDGITFLPSHIPGSEWTLGVAFSDDLHGIMSTVDISPTTNNFLYTADGGLTWNLSDQLGEQYGPVGVPKTKMFFAICENDAYHKGEAGKVIRSDDGGMNWKKVYQYHDKLDGVSVTGTMQSNPSSVFFQTIPNGSEGIMMSQDSGNTFTSLCGPPNIRDSRFYCRDSFLYAADKSGGLWINTTGIGSNSTPQFPVTSISVNASACAPTDTVITFSFFDSCSGVQAKLKSASLNGFSNFSLVAPSDRPRQIHSDDSIRIHYIPSLTLSDVAVLHLRFHLGFKDFDTSITLIGKIVANAEPRLSQSRLTIESSSCFGNDSLIIFSCFDSCTGEQAILETAVVEGSTNFSLLSPITFPKTIHANDSLIVRYAPVSFSHDTSVLRLHFRLGVIEVDTAIYLFGKRNVIVKSVLPFTKMNLNAYKCNSTDSVIPFSFFDSCTGTFATLLDAQLQGPNVFTLLMPSIFPHLTHSGDSLLISYDPKLPGKDTAKLLLHFALGFDFFDTVIDLYGGGRIPKENVRFIPVISPKFVEAGSAFNLLIKPDKMISGKGLYNISFDLNYYGDLLQKISEQNVIPNIVVTTGSPIRYGKQEVLHVTVTGNDITLDPSEAIADIGFKAMVTDRISTPVTMTNLQLNGGEVDYRNCILSADTSGTDFSVIFICGDSSISKFIRTGKVLDIISIRPNPAQDVLTLELNTSKTQSIRIEIMNALGEKEFSKEVFATSGKIDISIDTHSLPQGMHLIRITSEDGEAVQSFVKVKP